MMIRKNTHRFGLFVGAVALLALSLPCFADAQSSSYRVRRDGGSRVSFISDAPLETINGVSSVVSGSITVDPNDVRATRGTIEVPVSTLRTGVDLRDEHLHGESWLDAEHHPNATFEITSVSGPERLRPNERAELRVNGRFTIHGVTRDVTARVRVTWMPLTDEMRGTPGITGDVIRVSARFRINLEDYGVSVPSIVRLKVSNEIKIRVNLRAIAQS